jgi:hypothetical protein
MDEKMTHEGNKEEVLGSPLTATEVINSAVLAMELDWESEILRLFYTGQHSEVLNLALSSITRNFPVTENAVFLSKPQKYNIYFLFVLTSTSKAF